MKIRSCFCSPFYTFNRCFFFASPNLSRIFCCPFFKQPCPFPTRFPSSSDSWSTSSWRWIQLTDSTGTCTVSVQPENHSHPPFLGWPLWRGDPVEPEKLSGVVVVVVVVVLVVVWTLILLRWVFWHMFPLKKHLLSVQFYPLIHRSAQREPIVWDSHLDFSFCASRNTETRVSPHGKSETKT